MGLYIYFFIYLEKMSIESHRSESAVRSVKNGCEDFDPLELAQTAAE